MFNYDADLQINEAPMVQSLDPCTVKPRFNEVAGNQPNLFVKWRVRYTETLI